MLELLSAALLWPNIDRITVFASPARARRFRYPEHPKLRVREMAHPDSSKLARVLWHAIGLRRAAAEIGADALLCFNSVGMGSLPQIAFIQQSLPVSREAQETYPASKRMYLRVLGQMMRMCARRSRVVLVQTSTMANCVREVFGIELSRIGVVPCGRPAVSDVVAPVCPPAMSASGGERLLYVGSAAPYKNLTVLFRGLALLRARHPKAHLFLTCTAAELGENDGAYPLGYLTPELIAGAYRSSVMLVMPSLSETVGLPMIEAMATGVPVLAADRAYAHDVCGSAAIYFDPKSPAHFAEQASRLLDSPQLREELIRVGCERTMQTSTPEPWGVLRESLLDIVAGDFSCG